LQARKGSLARTWVISGHWLHLVSGVALLLSSIALGGRLFEDLNERRQWEESRAAQLDRLVNEREDGMTCEQTP